MDIKIIASTSVGNIAPKDSFDTFSGHAAGVCYMSSTFDELVNEDRSKTARRVAQTKRDGHHSVFDHTSISMYLHDVPKIVAMVINNEKQYTTSEKSARYTRMAATPQETQLYNKWVEIFKSRIIKKYGNTCPQYFTDSRIVKLAEENARLLTSVFTPTSLIYTTTYRQFNYLIAFIDKFIAKENKDEFETRLSDSLQEFVDKLKELPYYDATLNANEKSRGLSIFGNGKKVEEYYGDVYATSYKASFAEYAQAQRHRTISYNLRVLEDEYYVPKIIADSPDFTELWISDIKSLGNTYPQAQLCEVNEMGTLDAFILKMKERKCTYAQLEINQITDETLKKYEYALRMKIHPRAEEMMGYTKGSRCTFPDYHCSSPCGFADGVNGTREI